MIVAEQVWEWRVRALFAALCAVVVIATIIFYIVASRRGVSGVRIRRAFGRISVALFVVAAAEMGFFKDAVAMGILVASAIVIGVIGLRMPYSCADAVTIPSDGESVRR